MSSANSPQGSRKRGKRQLKRNLSAGKRSIHTDDSDFDSDDDAFSPSPQQQQHLTSSASSKRLRNDELGDIRLALLYDATNEELFVSVLEARNLPPLSTGGCPDPLVKVDLVHETTKGNRRKTKTKKKTCFPVWNETLAPFKLPKSQLREEIVRVQLYYWDQWDSNTCAGEAFFTTEAVQAYLEKVEVRAPFQPTMDKLKRSSSKRKTKKDAEPPVHASIMVSWLNQELVKDQTGKEKQTPFQECLGRLSRLKDKPWSAFKPQVAMLQGRDKKLAEALWELLTSEIAHLCSISVLMDPFEKYLTRILSSGSDPRVGGLMKKVAPSKIFGNIDKLRQISLRFAMNLEGIFLSSPSHADTGSAASPRRDSPQDIVPPLQELVHVDEVVNAFAAMQDELMGPEMEYRTQHKKSRQYLKRLMSSDTNFQVYVKWCEEDPRCGRLGLVDLLTQPLQRITRYPLLLKAILKQMGDESDTKDERDLLEAQIQTLETRIEEHNMMFQDLERRDKLRRLELFLTWPSVHEQFPNSYIPPSHHDLLTSRPRVSVATQLHVLDGRPLKTRDYLCDGWLGIVGKSGKEAERVFACLLDRILILAKPYSGQKMPRKSSTGSSLANIANDIADTSSGFLNVSGIAADSDSDIPEDDLEDGPMMVYRRPLHLSEVVIYDLPEEESASGVSNAFLVVELDGLGNPYESFTFTAESLFAKMEWLKQLRKGASPAPVSRKSSQVDAMGVLRRMSSASSGMGDLADQARAYRRDPNRRASMWSGGGSNNSSHEHINIFPAAHEYHGSSAGVMPVPAANVLASRRRGSEITEGTDTETETSRRASSLALNTVRERALTISTQHRRQTMTTGRILAGGSLPTQDEADDLPDDAPPSPAATSGSVSRPSQLSISSGPVVSSGVSAAPASHKSTPSAATEGEHPKPISRADTLGTLSAQGQVTQARRHSRLRTSRLSQNMVSINPAANDPSGGPVTAGQGDVDALKRTTFDTPTRTKGKASISALVDKYKGRVRGMDREGSASGEQHLVPPHRSSLASQEDDGTFV